METLQPRVAIIKAPGINCDNETAYGFELVGGKPKIVLIEDLKSGEEKLDNFQIVTFPGGFSHADDLGSGTVLALDVDTYLGNHIKRFIEKGLMQGTCNGFQYLMRSGLLPMGTLGERQATLDRNDSGAFRSMRVNLSLEPDNACIFLKDLKVEKPMEFQVAHGEGKFVTDSQTLSQIEANRQVVFRYVDKSGNSTQEYPFNPNGSPHGIAGICDPTGRILGLMPHPERSILRSQYPNSRRMPENFIPEGLQIFQSMVDYARQGI